MNLGVGKSQGLNKKKRLIKNTTEKKLKESVSDKIYAGILVAQGKLKVDDEFKYHIREVSSLAKPSTLFFLRNKFSVIKLLDRSDRALLFYGIVNWVYFREENLNNMLTQDMVNRFRKELVAAERTLIRDIESLESLVDEVETPEDFVEAVYRGCNRFFVRAGEPRDIITPPTGLILRPHTLAYLVGYSIFMQGSFKNSQSEYRMALVKGSRLYVKTLLTAIMRDVDASLWFGALDLKLLNKFGEG